jgi:hypothetical protein
MTAEASPQMSRPATRRKAGHRVLTAVIILFSVAAGLGLAEGLTRLFLPTFDPSGQFDFAYRVGALNLGSPGIAARQAKNAGDFDVTVRINRHGLRDDNDIATATANDIVVVGDSFAWGWGVEARDRFSENLQRLSGRRTFTLATPTDIEGYAALLAYAERLGAKLGQVVIALCMENDLRDYASAQADDLRAFDLKDWLAGRSAAYALLTTVVHRTPLLKATAARLRLIVPNLEGISRHEEAPEIIETSADRLQDIARQHRMLVVVIPSRALWVGDNRAVEDRVHRAFVAALHHRGIDVLDLRPIFEAQGTPLAYHFANDGHWNAGGHRLAAETAYRHFAR